MSTVGRLIIISGRSGSGKSTALHVLEDAGFYCVDNLPAVLLKNLVESADSEDESPLRMAVSIDARNMASSLSRFESILAELPDTISTEVLFLDSDDDELIKRFSETRRRHPLSNADVSLKEAIIKESTLLEPIIAAAALRVDTSKTTLHELRDLIAKVVVPAKERGLTLMFQSFGFKRGIPVDADIVYDVRCLPNPHWVRGLRAFTGLDQEVIEFLAAHDEVGEMLDDIGGYLEKWLPHFVRSNRSYVTIAIGCTGGQHRSVYISEALRQRFESSFPRVQVRHRELGHGDTH